MRAYRPGMDSHGRWTHGVKPAVPPYNCWISIFHTRPALHGSGLLRLQRRAPHRYSRNHKRVACNCLEMDVGPSPRTRLARTNAFFLTCFPNVASLLRTRYTVVSKYWKARVMSTCSMLWRFASAPHLLCTRHGPNAKPQHITFASRVRRRSTRTL